MITLVLGAQYGGEGKGKISSYLAFRRKYAVVCRCGGVNSSHTVVHAGRRLALRMMPATAVVDRSPFVVFGPGALIHIETLAREIELLRYDPRKIHIDPLAGIVSAECVEAQRKDARYSQLGSTLTGTGHATAMRALRKLRLARDYPELEQFITDTTELLFMSAKADYPILIEGHQGAGLSNYHGDYPYTSSRDCVAAELLSELGLGPKWEFEIFLVTKIFPTRNHAGGLYGEISEADADTLGIREFGGGSWGIENRRRRVGTLNFNELRRAARLNTPDFIALTGFDYFNNSLAGSSSPFELERDDISFIETVSREAGVKVGIISTGPETESSIDLLPLISKATSANLRINYMRGGVKDVKSIPRSPQWGDRASHS